MSPLVATLALGALELALVGCLLDVFSLRFGAAVAAVVVLDVVVWQF